MRRAKRILLAYVLPLVVLMGGVVSYVATLDYNAYHGQVVQEVEDYTGRKLTISGRIGGNFLTTRPMMILNDVTLANAKWGRKRPMAVAKRAKVEFAIWPLLMGSLKIKRLIIYDADILFQTSRQGVGNWEFQNVDGRRQRRPNIADRFELPFVRDVRLINSVVTYRDGLAKAETKLKLKRAIVQTDGFDSPVRLTIDGDHRGVPIKTTGTSGSIGSFLDGARHFPIRLKLAYSGSDLEADLRLDLNSAVTRFRGSIRSRRLDLDLLRGRGLERRLSATTPIPAGMLKALDADIKVRVGTLIVARQQLRRVRADLSVKNGELRLSPFGAQIAGGRVRGQLSLDGTGPHAVATVKLVGRNFAARKLTKLLFGKAVINARMTVHVDMAGAGKTRRKIVESAKGRVVALIRRGPVKTGLIAMPTTGLLGAINPWAEKDGSVTFNCIVGRFDFRKGVGRSRLLMADTAHASLSGKGTINLSKETIDVLLIPRTKKAGPASVGALVPIRVRGRLVDPNIFGDVGKFPEQAAKSFLGLVGKPFELLGEILNPDTGSQKTRHIPPCVRARSQAMGKALPKRVKRRKPPKRRLQLKTLRFDPASISAFD